MAQTVWVVEQGTYSDRTVIGVFTSLEKALERFGSFGEWKELGQRESGWARPGMWSNYASVPYMQNIDTYPLELDAVTDEFEASRLLASDL
jgi:hypothetical protein